MNALILNKPIDYKFTTNGNNSVWIVSMSGLKPSISMQCLGYYLEEYPQNRALQLACSDTLASTLLKEEVVINRSASGRPNLPNNPHTISISHTGDYLGVIISANGIAALDIELLERNIDRIRERFTSGSELERVSRLMDSNPLLVLWSIKECLFKAANIQGVLFKEHLLVFDVSLAEEGLVSKCAIKHPDLNVNLNVVSRIFGPLIVSYIDQPAHGNGIL